MNYLNKIHLEITKIVFINTIGFFKKYHNKFRLDYEHQALAVTLKFAKNFE